MPERISRRNLLSRAAATALAAPAAPAYARQRAARPKKVLVIGAGLAGLSAAYELIQLGHDVTVLEARLRAGGRVYTLREPFSDGLYAEAGALFIPANHALTLKYARLFDLTLHTVMARGSAEMYYIRGKRIMMRPGSVENWPLALTPEEKRLGYNGMWDRYVSPTVAQMGDAAAADWPPEQLRPLDQITYADFLRRQGASEDAVELLRHGYADLWGDGADSISALSLLRDLSLNEAGGKSYAIRGGNDQLPKAFAAGMKNRIQYGSAVLRIEQSASRVTVFARHQDERRTYTADRVVCAIPFTLLRRVEIEPAFSAPKQRAVQELPYTSVARVYLQERTRFWTEAGQPGIASTDLPVMWLWEPTRGQPGPRGILESYMAGASARKVTAMREADRISSTLEQMEKVFPGARDNFEGGASKCWDEDEWSRGDYAWFKPGQLTSLLPAISAVEGRIHFAGEHASPWPGWMQGALHSGSRAAREVDAAP